MPFNQAAGRKEGALRGELQVASVSSLRRSDRAVILPAGPPPVLLWQPVIIHRRDALSCRFQPRCKWTQMGSDRDQANNVLFISFAFPFFYFFISSLFPSSSSLSLCTPPLRWTDWRTWLGFSISSRPLFPYFDSWTLSDRQQEEMPLIHCVGFLRILWHSLCYYNTSPDTEEEETTFCLHFYGVLSLIQLKEMTKMSLYSFFHVISHI